MAFESIPSPYIKVRGACYLFTFPSVNASPPGDWTGVSGPDVAWDTFESGSTDEDVETQLTYFKNAGFNTLRVWLPFKPSETGYTSYDYAGDKAGFIAKFERFLELATAEEIYVIPILFDSFTKSPSEADQETYNADWANSLAKEFIDDIMGAVASYRSCVLMIDVYNEPWVAAAPASSVARATILNAAEQIKSADDTMPVLVGAAAWTDTEDKSAVATSEYVDVLSIHPYSLSPYFTKALTEEALDLAHKPILATECGAPGHGVPYFSAMEHQMKSVDRVRDQGIGFCVYQGMIGWSDPSTEYLHILSKGIFFHTGKVRDTRELTGIRKRAREQGYRSTYTDSQIAALQGDSEDSEWVLQYPVAAGQGSWEFFLQAIHADPGYVATLTSAQLTALAYELYTFTLYDVLSLATAKYYPWDSIDSTNISARYTEFNSSWAGYSTAQKQRLVRRWCKEATLYLPQETTPAGRRRRRR